ncbi:MAG: penicillin-binding transpeptidase domain-containing protein [Planctomycetaceae bacterium]
MLNSLQTTIFDADVTSQSELISPGNSLRLYGGGLLFTAAVFVILVRVYWVQTQLPERYLLALRDTSTEEESLPARDGRILADSIVLASDVDVYSVEVHYRWLQSKVDPQWLRLRVRQRLSRDERRNPQLTARVEDEIRAEHDSLRNALAEIMRAPVTDVTARFRKVEERVQRISDAVNRRREGSQADAAQDEPVGDSGWLITIAESIRVALTTPPSRAEENRTVVREEESWHLVLEDIGLSAAAMVNEHPERFPGVRIVRSTRRTYPELRLAAHVVGVRTNVRNSDLTDDDSTAVLKNSVLRIGRSGVERSYDHELRGVSGLRRTVRDRRQRVISSEIVRHPVSGRDLTVTLDSRLQQLCEQLLSESLGDSPGLLLPELARAAGGGGDDPEPAEPQPVPSGGCVIVMEADSGRLLAAASAPDFDLSMFTEGSPAMWTAVNLDARRPFVPRFSAMALPPGSTFKIVTAVAALESGTVTPDRPFECRGYLTRPDEHRCMIFRLFGATHGRVTLSTAMAQSCNVYFFDAARRMGVDQLVQWTDLLGFGRATGVDLPYEKVGNVPPIGRMSAAADTESAHRRFEREALGLSIGQSRLTVTPLQMARLLAFVANDGWLVTPHVVSDEGTARRASDIDNSPYRVTRRRIPGLQSGTLAAIRTGLRAAIEEPFGTGFRTVRLPGVAIAGKTGTAETSPGKPDHAWFAGYVPADNPQYVVVVVLEHGGSGSRAAGPIAREVVRSMADRGLLSL